MRFTWCRRDRSSGATAILARRHALELLAHRPFGLFRGDLDAFDQGGVLGLAPVRLHIAVAVGIEDTKLHRVHADQMRELVHLAFDRKIAVTPKPRMAVAGVRLVNTQ